jgi:hypothetical protein
MQLIQVRSVEGLMLPFLDRDGQIWSSRWVGWSNRTTRSDDVVEVHECQYYRDAINRGDILEVGQ